MAWNSGDTFSSNTPIWPYLPGSPSGKDLYSPSQQVTPLAPASTPSQYVQPSANQGSFSELYPMFVVPDKAQKGNDDDESWLDTVWDWANTDLGLEVIGGGIAGAAGMWGSEMSADNSLAVQEAADAAAMERTKYAVDHSEAVLKNARIGRHNTSINKPINLRLRT